MLQSSFQFLRRLFIKTNKTREREKKRGKEEHNASIQIGRLDFLWEETRCAWKHATIFGSASEELRLNRGNRPFLPKPCKGSAFWVWNKGHYQITWFESRLSALQLHHASLIILIRDKQVARSYQSDLQRLIVVIKSRVRPLFENHGLLASDEYQISASAKKLVEEQGKTKDEAYFRHINTCTKDRPWIFMRIYIFMFVIKELACR